MAKNRANTVKRLAEVKNIGPKVAERLFDELKITSVAELVAAAEKNELQVMNGIGAAKENAILKSARAIQKTRGANPSESKPEKTKPRSVAKRETLGPTESVTYQKPIRKTGRVTVPGLMFKLAKRIVKRVLP